MSKITYVHDVGGIPTDAISVVFGDPTNTYGVKRQDNGDVVISDGYPLDHIGDGQYEYEFDDPDYDLVYSYSFRVEYPAATYNYVTGLLVGPTLTIESKTFVLLDDANTYFEDRLFADAWENASDPDKQKALIMSTKAIRALALMDFDETPQDIKDATCENAYALLDGVDPEMEFENLSMVQQAYAKIRSTYNRDISMEHIESGIVSITAWRLIKPYLDVSRTLKFSRVS